MNYVVDWRAVEAALVQILDTAPSEAAVIRAAERLDAVLGYCPVRASESRSGEGRVAVELPLIITFTVNEAGRRVSVLRIRFRERPDLG